MTGYKNFTVTKAKTPVMIVEILTIKAYMKDLNCQKYIMENWA